MGHAPSAATHVDLWPSACLPRGDVSDRAGHCGTQNQISPDRWHRPSRWVPGPRPRTGTVSLNPSGNKRLARLHREEPEVQGGQVKSPEPVAPAWHRQDAVADGPVTVHSPGEEAGAQTGAGATEQPGSGGPGPRAGQTACDPRPPCFFPPACRAQSAPFSQAQPVR